MAYSEELAERVRFVLADRADLDERRMFGGLAFMLGGHMACGIIGDELMVRVGPDATGSALARPHTRPMDFTGRPMKGMVYVGAEGLRSARQLRTWVHMGAGFADSLPPRR